MKKFIFLILLVAAFVLILPFGFNNAEKVTVNYWFFSYSLRLSWVIIGAFILGVLFSLCFFGVSAWVWKLKAKTLQKQLNEMDKIRKKAEIKAAFDAECQS
ncbi:lipopolysaccharide assembly protein LapA domain-containing protein [Ostreibacterium oceani]|uniref:DUF1049 domain-containing protein n=1 Tax=Ostreibacterium oceani TaxID=2654998 RepID=A0A6N7EZF2_9GAMM|nr:LapA family protein [Ostreibacterium oceani]MPV86557.1 DUF1049 domain-containing protein [Ostreibacterium oceani]